MKVTFAIPNDVAGLDSNPDARYAAKAMWLIMIDALGEFISHRKPCDDYVATRYPWYNDNEKADKVHRTFLRCNVAEVMKHAIHEAEITNEEPAPDEYWPYYVKQHESFEP